MFLRIGEAKDVDVRINAFFQYYRTDILSVMDKIWKEENIYEKSKCYDDLYNYYLALHYAILLYNDYKTTRPTDDNYFSDKYTTEVIRKCLKCKDISLDKIMELFGIPPEILNGIQGTDIEDDFIVEPPEEAVEVITINLSELLASPSACTKYIESYGCN